MKLALVCALALGVAVGCGPTQPGGGDDEGVPVDDTDGDTIGDADEGRGAAKDTDRDGTPDYQDLDSDGDGIPDAREAGDGDPRTAPFDSDGDGAPDFQDLDSDQNGREDAIDGVGDVDGDAIGDWADPDDDADDIWDLDELGPNPLQPADTDGDGTPDYRDRDSDDDTIVDWYESHADYDNDGTANYRDLDSDGDCTGDRLEARGDPPKDSDGDSRPDFIDRDADNDGVPDVAEDRNCNGAVDPGETSAVAEDTDGDGVSDLVETAAGTDPTNPGSNPQANGDFVFVVPHMKPQYPAAQDLDFRTNLQAVDLYVLLDRSGSMSTEIITVKNNLASVVAGLKCLPGQTANCIPDLWAGAGTVGYTTSGAAAYQNYVDIQPNPSFVSVPVSEPGGCCEEPLSFASYAAVTGQGGAPFGFSAVPARATCGGSPAANGGYVPFGYPCFRTGALPVIMLATDEPPISAGDTNKNPPWGSVVAYYQSTRARLVGIYGSGPAGNTINDLRQMATDTGAIDAQNANQPLVFSGADANASTAIQQGILRLANGLPLDINATNVDDPSDAVDAIAAFVDHIETLQLGTPQCSAGLTDVDTNGDTFDDKFLQVRTGTPVCWKVTSKPNTTVPALDAPQLFRSKIKVYGDGVTQLDERDVFFLVPPKPFDGPLQ